MFPWTLVHFEEQLWNTIGSLNGGLVIYVKEGGYSEIQKILKGFEEIGFRYNMTNLGKSSHAISLI